MHNHVCLSCITEYQTQGWHLYDPKGVAYCLCSRCVLKLFFPEKEVTTDE